MKCPECGLAVESDADGRHTVDFHRDLADRAVSGKNAPMVTKSRVIREGKRTRRVTEEEYQSIKAGRYGPTQASMTVAGRHADQSMRDARRFSNVVTAATVDGEIRARLARHQPVQPFGFNGSWYAFTVSLNADIITTEWCAL